MKYISHFLLILLTSNLAVAQESQLQFSFAPTMTNFQVTNGGQPLEDGFEFGYPASIFSIGYSTKVKNNWWVNTQIGFNEARGIINFSYEGDEYRGTFFRDQFFMSLRPEYHWSLSDGNTIHVGAGLGYYQIFNSGFDDGRRRGISAYQSLDRSSFAPQSQSRIGYELNAGTTTHFTPNLGFLLNLGFVFMESSISNPELPKIGFQQLFVQMGLVCYLYRPESTEH